MSVTTPLAGAMDARRVGVRADGSYWGTAGEQIDVRSGNLNITLPLLRAEGRGGWGVGFNLSYNSQNWRKDTAAIFKLGVDVGYGFGWRLMAGSIVPVYSNSTTVSHYVFTDSTGAEYQLNVNNGGVWTSRESVYVKYDANQAKLLFPDGSAWEMNSVSAASEDDAGTRYPTRMEDTNGNYVNIEYRPAKGATYVNSSARIGRIEDVRATAPSPTYEFTYNNDETPHLTGITNNINTAENFVLSYIEPRTLYAPFSPMTSFGTAQMLQFVHRPSQGWVNHYFEYGWTNAGEMSRMVLPFGGDLRWTYGDFTYANGRTYREVTTRQLVKQRDGTPVTYTFNRPPGDSAYLCTVRRRWMMLEGSGSGRGSSTPCPGSSSRRASSPRSSSGNCRGRL
ncbi:MAG: hypothetical protein JNL98_35010 [Bryobacterales bacterium]|nr:hypothetical protein [Bryobacterales bacterium]